MYKENEKQTGLDESAFRPLKEGEVYKPVMSPDKNYPEVNLWSVSWGIAMAVLFSAASAYLGLKVGQVFEAAIPIAIIAVGVSSLTKRKGALGENPVNRCMLGRNRCRCNLYFAGSLYSAEQIPRNDG